MNQFRYQRAEIDRLVSQLRIRVAPKYRRFCNPEGPQGRLNRMRTIVTNLIKYERLELFYPHADESRGYAERVRGVDFYHFLLYRFAL